MNGLLHLLRVVLGTPVVFVAFVACFVVELLVLCTIIGVVIVWAEHEDGRSGFFGPAISLAKLVYA